MGLQTSRVVEIFTPPTNGHPAQVGSGYRISAHLVLTARHVVEAVRPDVAPDPAESPLPEILSCYCGDESLPTAKVRLLSDGKGAKQRAVVLWSHEEHDVALLGVLSEDWPRPEAVAATWTYIKGVDPVSCTAVGFPAFDTAPDGTRDSRQISAEITPLTHTKGQRWAITIEGQPGGVPSRVPSVWGGMSGASVLVGGDIVGVIVLDPSGEDPKRMELWATPTHLFAKDDAGFNAWISADAEGSPWRFVPRRLRSVSTTEAEQPLIPHQAPVPREFGLVGRDDLLRTAIEELTRGTDVALVSGLPGVGKTALAAQLVATPELRQEFPDGALWLPVGVQEEGQMSHWVHRMAGWARQLHVRDDAIASCQSSEDGFALMGLVNEALGERCAILVFDDVWDLTDARNFSSLGRECRRILTTRLTRVAANFQGAMIQVGELDPATSEQLLVFHLPQIATVFADLKADLLRVAAGIPLALVIIGMHAREQLTAFGDAYARQFLTDVVNLGAQDLEIELPDREIGQKPANSTLGRLIELTTRRLSANESSALQALTIFPPKANTFSDSAAAYVAGRPNVLSLRQNGLLDLMDPVSTRWSMHQAIFDFARRNADDDQSGRSLLEFMVKEVERLAKESSPDWVTGIDRDTENVRAAFEWAIRHEESDLALRLMAALFPFWYERNLFQRARELADRVLRIPSPADSSKDHELLRAKVLNDSGNYAFNMADLLAAEDCYKRSLDIRQRHREIALTAGSLNNLGLIARERGDYPTALRLTQEALRINETRPHDDAALWQAMNHNNLGIIMDRMGEHEAAIASQRRSIELFDRLSRPWGAAMAQIDQAAAMINLGRIEKADTVLMSTLRERWQANDHKRVAAAIRGKARILERDDPSQSTRLLKAALSLSVPVSDRLGEVAALAGIVVSAARQGQVVDGARAAGALSAWIERSGITFSPWRTQCIEAARGQLRALDPDRFDAETSNGHDALANEGLSSLAAMGIIDDSAGVQAAVATLLAGNAPAPSQV